MLNKTRAIRDLGKRFDGTNREEFMRLMAFALQLITATNDLLRQAGELSTGKLKEYYVKHYEEEKQHEQWLREDLEGYEIPTNSLAVAIAGSQYYLIRHKHPACLLGYMLCLEDPIDSKHAEAMKVHGKLARTFMIHAHEDKAHLSELIALINEFPELHDEIEFSALHTANLLSAYE